MLLTTGTVTVSLVFARVRVRACRTLQVKRLAGARRADLREVWPEVVDNLASAVRAGLSLPEALGALAVRGPEVLRPPFARFAADYRSSGRFGACLDRLKDDLADPVGDRIVETLRVAREVGGSDLGRVLRTLATFLREDARARAELETRQGWVVQAARLAVAAPWVVLLLLATQSTTLAAYDSPAGHGDPARRRRGLPRRLPADAADRPAAAGRAGAAVSATLAGMLLGLVGATGLVLVVTYAPPFRSVRLVDRLAPYVHDTPPPSRLLGTATEAGLLTAVRRVFGPAVGDGARLIDRFLGGRAAVRRRLDALGDRRHGRGLPHRAGGLGRARPARRRAARDRRLGDGGQPQRAVRRAALPGRADGGVLGPRLVADPAGAAPRGAAARRVPRRRRAAGAGRDRGRGSRGGDRPGHPALRRRAGARARRGASAGRGPGCRWSRRCSRWPTGRRWTRWRASSTGCSSPSSAARRWPRCCGPRRPTSARPASAGCSRRAAARRSPMMVPVVFLVLPVTVLFALFPGLISIVSLAQ